MTTLENRPKTALLVIDVQNGVMGGAHDRDRVIANIATLIGKARAAGDEGPAVESVDGGSPCLLRPGR